MSVKSDTGILKPYPFNIGSTSGSNEQMGCAEAFGFTVLGVMNGKVTLFAVDSTKGDIQADVDTCIDHFLLYDKGTLFVDVFENPSAALKHTACRSQLVEHLCQFTADGTRTDEGDLFRQVAVLENVGIGPCMSDTIALEWRHKGIGSRCHNGIVKRHLLTVNVKGVGIDKGGIALFEPEIGETFHLFQCSHRAQFDDLRFVRKHRFPVNLPFGLYIDMKRFHLFEHGKTVGGIFEYL